MPEGNNPQDTGSDVNDLILFGDDDEGEEQPKDTGAADGDDKFGGDYDKAVKSYNEAEKLATQRSQEAAEYRKKLDAAGITTDSEGNFIVPETGNDDDDPNDGRNDPPSMSQADVSRLLDAKIMRKDMINRKNSEWMGRPDFDSVRDNLEKAAIEYGYMAPTDADFLRDPGLAAKSMNKFFKAAEAIAMKEQNNDETIVGGLQVPHGQGAFRRQDGSNPRSNTQVKDEANEIINPSGFGGYKIQGNRHTS